MANITTLLHLPNELCSLIFGYLNSADLIDAFAELRSARLQALIDPFVTHLNITGRSLPWLEHYLPLVVAQHDVSSISLRDEHLDLVCRLLPSTQVSAMQILTESAECFTGYEDLLKQLCRQLKSLSIRSPSMNESFDLLPLLLHTDSRIEQLAVHDCALYFEESMIQPCTHLTSLLVQLEGTHHLFLLLKHSPALEKLQAKFISNECLVQPDPDDRDIVPCAHLRRVTIRGQCRHFSHLTLFFAKFGSTFEQVSIDVDLMFAAVDGQVLEQNFLARMPRLNSLELFIQSNMVDEQERTIETFQSTAWQPWPPIVYCCDSYTSEQTLFTLPFRSKEFLGLSNSRVSSWTTNRPCPSSLKQVHHVSLNVTTPLTLATCQFIDQMFPRLERLSINRRILLADDIEQVDLMASCLQSDTTVELPSVHRLELDTDYLRIDHVTFHRLLRALPYLTHLHVSTGEGEGSSLAWLCQSNQELQRNASSRVREVSLRLYDEEEDGMASEKLPILFPNAVIRIDAREDLG